LTAAYAMFQGWGIAASLEEVQGLVPKPGIPFRLSVTLSPTAGAMLLVWLGEQITRTGFCDGIWLVVAAFTIAELPRFFTQAVELASSGQVPSEAIALSGVFLVTLAALTVVLELAYRALRVQSLEASALIAIKTTRVQCD
jgi:preprotein translocase subunit SecY